jgi:hypothetical protein
MRGTPRVAAVQHLLSGMRQRRQPRRAFIAAPTEDSILRPSRDYVYKGQKTGRAGWYLAPEFVGSRTEDSVRPPKTAAYDYQGTRGGFVRKGSALARGMPSGRVRRY